MILAKNIFCQNGSKLARSLLGKYLVRRVNGKTRAYMIVETEAYHGLKDKASKARHGRTKHNDPMWGPPGRWYVYFTYGMHWMLNIVTGKDNFPSAVLIRALELTPKHSHILQNVRMSAGRINGPGRVTKTLKIDGRLNGKLASRASGLWIEDRGVRIPRSKIRRTGRIGVDYAGEWAKKPLRYIVES